MEEVIRNGVEAGAYSSADQFVEEAVRLLYRQEQWLRENRDAISEKIEAGWASAQRGDLLTEREVSYAMRAHKLAFLSSQGK